MRQYELEAGAAVRRIAIFGDKRVVEALAKWYRLNPLPPCEESMKPEIATWQTMRDASPGKGQEVSVDDVAAIEGRCIFTVKQ